MKQTTVTLAGKAYRIESLKFKQERAWRKKYDAPLGALIDAISKVRLMGEQEFEKPADLFREIGAALLSHANELLKAMLNSPDLLFDAICDYSPQVRADRDYIEEHAYQDEIAAAFLEVLKIAYPFGSLLGIVKSLGSQEKQISPNSPDMNGDSGKMT